MPAKVLGIVGGIAPGSTVDYYRQLIDGYRARVGDGHYPAILLNSIDMTTMLGLIGEGRLEALVTYLGSAVEALARAGAEVGLLASNTPHLVFDALKRRSPIPLISIVEAAAEAAGARGLRTLGLLGTRFTMDAGFYPEAFARRGMAVRPPLAEERDAVHRIYMVELTEGEFRPESQEQVLAIVGAMAERDRLDGVLLAGTELPLLLRGAEPGIPLLDTTRIHVAAALDAMLGG